jgi:hypothetical protein
MGKKLFSTIRYIKAWSGTSSSHFILDNFQKIRSMGKEFKLNFKKDSLAFGKESL